MKISPSGENKFLVRGFQDCFTVFKAKEEILYCELWKKEDIKYGGTE